MAKSILAISFLLNNPQTIERFWNKAALTADITKCWEWQFGTSAHGYGQVGFQNTCWRAHRVAYYLYFQVDPGNLLVCHHCDNPSCINPHHLFLGTPRNNTEDALTKGRLRFGSRKNQAKITESDVIEIRRRAWLGEPSSQISQDYPLAVATIKYICAGKSWKHVAMPAGQRTSAKAIGSANGSAKLNEQKVRVIKLRLAAGESRAAIGRDNGVSVDAIAHIKSKKRWAHVTLSEEANE